MARDVTLSGTSAAYNLTLAAAASGNGQTVAIVDAYDDPDAESDLAVYRAEYGLPPCTTANGCFDKVNQEGEASPLPAAAGTTGWATEESLDLDMVSAICPNCDTPTSTPASSVTSPPAATARAPRRTCAPAGPATTAGRQRQPGRHRRVPRHRQHRYGHLPAAAPQA